MPRTPKDPRTGQFKKGQSGNPSGRPKSENIPKEVLDFVKTLETREEQIEFWDKYLLENPKTYSEIKNVLSQIRDSYKPKLKSIENKTIEDKTVTITWIGFNPKEDQSYGNQIESKDYEEIDMKEVKENVRSE